MAVRYLGGSNFTLKQIAYCKFGLQAPKLKCQPTLKMLL